MYPRLLRSGMETISLLPAFGGEPERRDVWRLEDGIPEPIPASTRVSLEREEEALHRAFLVSAHLDVGISAERVLDMQGPLGGFLLVGEEYRVMDSFEVRGTLVREDEWLLVNERIRIPISSREIGLLVPAQSRFKWDQFEEARRQHE